MPFSGGNILKPVFQLRRKHTAYKNVVRKNWNCNPEILEVGCSRLATCRHYAYPCKNSHTQGAKTRFLIGNSRKNSPQTLGEEEEDKKEDKEAEEKEK